MCTVSVIYDMFTPLPDEWYTKERIDLFRSMLVLAETFDQETGQPDCVDPEKAKLKEKIDALEEELENDYRGADCD
jgi:hypothetical protein